EAEEKAALYAKQKEIQRIEDARLRELAKKEGNVPLCIVNSKFFL
ncbi:unnamed protein product, partial [Allacma fusca]